MATPYSTLTNKFLKRVERDIAFFNYLNLSDADASTIVELRSEAFLHEALARVMTEGMPEVDFADVDDMTKQINFDLTPKEEYLIVSLMYEAYLTRDIAKLKCLSVNYTSTDLRVFDPSNARTSFKALWDAVAATNVYLIDIYKSSDRVSGAYKGISYSAYDDVDG